MKKIFLLMLVVLLILAILIPSLSQAQNYGIPWWTIDGGGGTSMGDNYSLSGSIGQPDAGVLSGGTYSLIGGFWGISFQQFLYLPIIRDRYP